VANENRDKSKLAVLVGGERPGGGSGIDWSSMHVPVETVEQLEKGRASRTVEDLGETIVIDGDDRVVSRALTAYRRTYAGRERPVQLVPLRTGSVHRVADAVGGPRPSERLARQLAEAGAPDHWHSHDEPTLRVTTSARPAPLWGFSLGAGIVYRLFETVLRTEGEGLSGLGSMASRLARRFGEEANRDVAARGDRVSVDYEPLGDSVGYVVATALSSTWLGLSRGGTAGPVWWRGDSGREFVRNVASSAAIPGFLGGGSAETFGRLHIDGPGGFVLDGALFDPGEPHVLEVASGRDVTFLTP